MRIDKTAALNHERLNGKGGGEQANTHRTKPTNETGHSNS